MYIDRGNRLRNEVSELSSNINQAIKSYISGCKMFYFVEASSGSGKSQLAQALSMPVVYIPLSYSQPMYECFEYVSSRVLEAVRSDMKLFCDVGTTDIEVYKLDA
jgi:adenylate kinase family enzyme